MVLFHRQLTALLLTSAALAVCCPGNAQTKSQAGYSRTTQCFRDEYREEYVPGTKARPGYVRNWTEKVEIACEGAAASISQPKVDNNDCSQGSVIGGLLGAGVGAALSRDKGRWVGVPVGAAAGALVGCQVDGG
jgi:uncharacterized protein YcfJ